MTSLILPLQHCRRGRCMLSDTPRRTCTDNEDSIVLLCSTTYLSAEEQDNSGCHAVATPTAFSYLPETQIMELLCSSRLQPNEIWSDHWQLWLVGSLTWKLPVDLGTPANRECPFSFLSQNLMQKSRLLLSHRPILLVILVNHVLPWNLCFRNHHNLTAEPSSWADKVCFSKTQCQSEDSFSPHTGFLTRILTMTKTFYLLFCPHAHKECRNITINQKKKKKKRTRWLTA